MDNRTLSQFHTFFFGSIIYSFIYTFFLYKNSSGITYPFFVGGTLWFFFLCLKKLEITAKKDSIFYIISILLLGLSTCMTTSWSLIFMNKIAIFILLFCLMLHNFYDDSKWNFTKYLSAIFQLSFGSIAFFHRPFTDCAIVIRSKRAAQENRESKLIYVFYGILIALPLLLISIILLSSADLVFANIFEDFFHNLFNLSFSVDLIYIMLIIFFAFFSCYSIIVHLCKKNINTEIADKRTAEPIIAITFTSMLSLIYIVFSFIQIFYLFLVNLQLPQGHSYAGYARQGFFELLFVCLLNLVIVQICLARFRSHKILKSLLSVIIICTYIMIASSCFRMILYIKYYHLTFLRIFVLWSLLVIFLLMTGLLIQIYKETFPLFKYSMVVITVLYLSLSFLHPDYWIARYNISQLTSASAENEIAMTDFVYLNHLSSDAASILLNDDYIENLEPGIFNKYKRDIRTDADQMDIRTFNFSLFMASRRL